MDTTTATIKPITGLSEMAGRVSFAAAATAMLLLAALHLLSPEFDPSWRFVSEYALGQYSWALALMFLSLAVSCVALFLAIKSQVPTRTGKAGLAFLLAAAVGMAAIFDWTHNLHGLAAMIGNPGFTLAALLISLSLVRNRPWSSARRWLLWAANLPRISFVLLIATVFIGLSRSSGVFGPDVPVGWPNRLRMVAYGIWLMLVAWHTTRLDEDRSAHTTLG